ncbi:HAMP domain-containing histidine kinase [Archangium violaceum]|uniref:sensor histidine kinase n=1 Tax=Archangium violaceum TaxID=83451 RepID=UPI00194E6FCE|nr:HAMP domain-containing sensor histidine kinase [Archangium violaceum]QRO00091.1 HAMP domain-containing histidine kinase [Archangium violaceum]
MNAAPSTGWRRLLPRTLAARLALILFSGLLLAHALSFALLFSERYMVARSMMLTHLDQDVVVSVALLERLSPAERARWAPRLERRTYRYLLGPARPGVPLTSDRAREVTALIDRSLDHRYRLQARTVSTSPERFEVQLTLADGQPLTIEVTPSVMPIARWLPVVLAAQLALLLLCAWLAVRLATRPLVQLADAVERLDPARAHPPLPREGPVEVVKAATAFNAMQARIGHYLAERLQILAAISHDLQTPITRMKLRLEAMEEGADRDRLIDDLEQLLQLVREGIAYARSTHGATGPAVWLDLHALLDSVVCDYQDAGKPVTLGECARASLSTRPPTLRRIVENLIDNAVKYGGSAEVGVRRLDDGRMAVDVCDRGPGIPEQEMQAVLQPFYRLESSRNRDTGGTGLGLAIAQQLVVTLGGELVLANRDGGGLRATLLLPVAPASTPTPAR